MKRSRLVPFVVLLSLAASAGLAQDDTGNTPSTPKGGIPTFHFDLRSVESDPVLPFDQLFNIRAKVNSEVQSGQMQFHAKSDDCTFHPDDKATIAGRRVVRTNNDVELLFSVPSIEPNVDYCFVFRTARALTPAEVTAFRAKARDLIDRATLTVGLSDVSSAERKALRDQIAAEMQKLGEEQHSEVVEGTTFGKNPTREAQESFNSLLQELSEANGNQELGTGNYCRNHETALRTVTDLMDGGAPAPALLDAIAKAAKDADNRALVKIVDAEAAATLNAVLVEKEYKRVLNRGCEAVKAFKSPDEAKDLQSDLERVRAQLADVKSLIAAVVADDAAAKSVGLTTKEQKTGALDVSKSFETAAEELAHLRMNARNLAQTLTQREQALDAATDEVERQVREDVSVLATSTADFVTRHGFYVTMDVGVASAWDIDEVVSYTGMNFYTRPINKAAPLRWGAKGNFRRRFSGTLGLTLQTLNKTGAYKGVLSDHALVGAVGWRVLDSVKITGGGLLLKENDRNPLVDKTHLAVTPFVAISLDWDVRNTFKNLGSAFGLP